MGIGEGPSLSDAERKEVFHRSSFGKRMRGSRNGMRER